MKKTGSPACHYALNRERENTHEVGRELDHAMKFVHVDFEISVIPSILKAPIRIGNMELDLRKELKRTIEYFSRVSKLTQPYHKMVNLSPHQCITLALIAKLLSPDGLVLPDWRV